MWQCCEITYAGIRFYCEVKVYEEPSKYGINGGRVSKLMIRIAPHGEILVNYDRGWDIKPTTPEAKAVCDILLKRFNW